ncbi:hypothetical protein BABINDRAFT_160315 [Babjeviella inositovora NRRL Y-12698]|uniref:B-related factor 1 n=1 Tax=Babjeviella inositovora NRRL Y-12698 TaxID=984486 RepID=A0A1E3QWS4_9ASCO|nr:uncharacterized protein BABINDRAFT_160315 [Babjeviella inositovora NRRL Y-12698]ODQ82138.1 hypothetical protein BABINDRAFT_160315 [Babjeviella inositovora NRRL Y-12698]
MTKRICKKCGGTEFSTDQKTASQDTACVVCGTVLEDNPIVSAVTYGESSSGAAVAHGTMVAGDQAHANFGGGRGSSMESREQTLANGRRRIKNVAAALKIPDYIHEAAFHWFQLALTNNFVQGRRSQNVVAACLYVACRKEKTHHMLIDFSSRLQISVYSVGATFLKMVKALHITSLPLADPSLFIQHFAEKLEFGDAKIKVVRDAVKLAGRMADDWIHEGRRPAGIAGACVLLAARMNNFRRTHAEIVAVAHVGEDTLQRRLNEFKKTNSGKLSIAEFRSSDKVEPLAPPSFTRNRKKDLAAQQQRVRELASPLETQVQSDPILQYILNDCDLSEKEIKEQLARVTRRATKRASAGLEPNYSAAVHGHLDEVEKMIMAQTPRNLVKNLPKSADLLALVRSDPENFDDVEDEELEGFLLTEEESKLKERVWTGLNQEFLLDQEMKRLKAESDEAAGHSQTPSQRRKRKRSVDDEDLVKKAIEDATEYGGIAGAARSILPKKLSKKINYDAIGAMSNIF